MKDIFLFVACWLGGAAEVSFLYYNTESGWALAASATVFVMIWTLCAWREVINARRRNEKRG